MTFFSNFKLKPASSTRQVQIIIKIILVSVENTLTKMKSRRPVNQMQTVLATACSLEVDRLEPRTKMDLNHGV